jgi:hypothetical protein
MKKLFFLLLAAPLFLFSSCDDDTVLSNTASVQLNFKAVYDGEPLVFQNSAYQYKYPEGNQIRFTDLKFFIADVALLQEEGGEESKLVDIEYVNFSNNTTLEEAQRATSLSFDNIPVGQYKALRIGIGVPANLNNENYSTYDENHPLRKNSGEFWAGWNSFIFMKINGSYDIGGDGLGNGTDASIAHHLGGNQFYKTIILSKAINIEPDQNMELNLELDLAKLYQNSAAEILDLSDNANWGTHDQSKVDAISFMTNNYGQAFSLK